MKKIISIIAVAASCFTAFGACEYIKPDTAWVYKWKFTGKTTYGTKPAKVKTVTSSLCGYNGSTAQTQSCVIRTKASLLIEGYTWACSPGCGSDAFETFSESNEIFWQKKPFRASLAGGVFGEVSNIIGKNGKHFETAGTATFTEFLNGTSQEGIYKFTYAGIGKYDLKNKRVKSVSGNFAGILDQPHYIATDFCGTAGFWDCSTMSLVCEGPSVVYGKWSCKFQKKASRKYNSKGVLPKYPSWVVPMNNN